MKEFGIKVLKKVRDLVIIVLIFVVVIAIVVIKISEDQDTIDLAAKVLMGSLLFVIVGGTALTVITWNKTKH